MMSRFHLKRRTFLRGIGNAMVALPVLECMLNNHGTALAQGTPLPRRFGVFFWGNGMRKEHWVPSATGPGYALSTSLAPLAPVRDFVNVVTNYEVKAAGPRGHHNGVSGMLSGVEFVALEHPNSNYSSKFGGPSIDHLLHGDLGVPASKPVLNLRTAPAGEIVSGEGPTLQFISHRGSDAPQPPEETLASAFGDLFGGLAPTDAMDPRRALRTSVLDLVKDDIDRLKPRLSTNDRRRLDAHLTGISELRERIRALPPEFTGTCRMPEPVTSTPEGLRAMCDAQADLIAMAFACDIRQIATLQFTGSVGSTRFPGTGAGHHDMTHDPAQQAAVQATTVFTMECFSSVMQKMAALPEGAGSLLDNSLWLATSDCAEGLDHSVDDYPIVLVGRAGGAMRYPGTHVRGPSLFKKNTNDVLLTIARAMGSSRASIGEGFTQSTNVVSEVLAS
jgi:hypothetical protein